MAISIAFLMLGPVRRAERSGLPVDAPNNTTAQVPWAVC